MVRGLWLMDKKPRRRKKVMKGMERIEQY